GMTTSQMNSKRTVLSLLLTDINLLGTNLILASLASHQYFTFHGESAKITFGVWGLLITLLACNTAWITLRTWQLISGISRATQSRRSKGSSKISSGNQVKRSSRQ